MKFTIDNNTTLSTKHTATGQCVCPACGACPTCGQRALPYWPPPFNAQPWYVPNTGLPWFYPTATWTLTSWSSS